MSEAPAQLTILIKGRVQGVFYRRGVKAEADKLSLVGEASNLDHGTVQVIAQGKKGALQKLLDWCYHGTVLTKVESLKFTWLKPARHFPDFKVVKRGTVLEDKILALKNLSLNILEKNILPKHVAIIPDGNRRWAKNHKFQIFHGHEKGIDNIQSLMDESLRLKIPYLTLWGFSTENWRRPKQEVKFLMNISRRYLKRLKEKLVNYQVQFRHFGRKDRLPEDILKNLESLESETKNFSKAHFGLAIDYGGRDELLRALEKISNANEKISEESLAKNLDTRGFPDPDLIIRTSGEQRLSGLMPWQATYAELYFSPVLFPDFDVLEFRKAIADFSARRRNFGS